MELAEDGGKIAAYANLRILGDEAELMRIAVLKNRRQEGIEALLFVPDALLHFCTGPYPLTLSPGLYG